MADDSFKAFVMDQLSALPELRAKAMFGGYGLYSGEHFFGILDEGRVFFKVDDGTRADYEARGEEESCSLNDKEARLSCDVNWVLLFPHEQACLSDV